VSRLLYKVVAVYLNVQQDTILIQMFARNVIRLVLFVNSQIFALNVLWIGLTAYFIFSEISNARVIVVQLIILIHQIRLFIFVEIVLQIAALASVRKSAQHAIQDFF
jgi:hypothetical protein